MRRGFTFLALIIAALAAVNLKANTITVTGGFSGSEADASGNTTAIYAGIAGSPCTGDGVSTCSSCTEPSGSGANICGFANIYPGLKVVLNFRTETAINGQFKYVIQSDGDGTGSTISWQERKWDGGIPAGGVVSYEFTWSEFCSKYPSQINSSCVPLTATGVYLQKSVIMAVDINNNGTYEEGEKKAVTFRFHGVGAGQSVLTNWCTSETNSELGVCSAKFAAGDEKAYIEELTLGGGPQPGAPLDAMAVFPLPTTAGGEAATLNSFSNGSVSPKILKISDDGTLQSDSVGGVNNYHKYCFVFGAVNKAQILYSVPNAVSNINDICLAPSEVVGILDDKHCFISTAAFGSDLAPQVEVFRKFRNEFLLNNDLGMAFVHLYYKYGPEAAQVISANEGIRTIVRWVLYPVLVFSYLALKLGLIFTTLVFFGLFSVLTRLKKRVGRSYMIVSKVVVIPFLFFFFGLVFSDQAQADILPKDSVQIQHPGAADGLIRIKEDGTYVYATEREFKKQSGHFYFGYAKQPEISIDIEIVDVNGNGTDVYNTYTFDDFYGGASNLIIGYDYEWYPFSKYGRLGVQVGGSLMYAEGHGILVATQTPSIEKYHFLTLPVNVGLIYRFEWVDKQLLVPYVSGGGVVLALMESRNDGSTPKFTGGLGFYGSGGLMLNLGRIDEETGFSLESEYGISNMWLTAELRIIEVPSEAFRFSNQMINAGLSFDF